MTATKDAKINKTELYKISEFATFVTASHLSFHSYRPVINLLCPVWIACCSILNQHSIGKFKQHERIIRRISLIIRLD